MSTSASRLTLLVARVGEECPAPPRRRRRQTGQVEIDAANELRCRCRVRLAASSTCFSLAYTSPSMILYSGTLLPGETAAVAHDDRASGPHKRPRSGPGPPSRRGAPPSPGPAYRPSATSMLPLSTNASARDIAWSSHRRRWPARPSAASCPAAASTGFFGNTSMDLTRGRLEIEFDAAGDPGAQQFVIRLARLGEHAADMGHGAGAFEQHQAGSGAARLNRRPLQIVGQGAVVEQRIVAAERQLEAVLARLARRGTCRRCSPS